MSSTPAATAGAARGTPSPGLDAAWDHPVLGRMLRAQRRLHRANQRRPWLLDTVVTLCAFILTLPAVFGRQVEESSVLERVAPGLRVALAVGLVVPLWWRRRAPGTTLLAVLAASAALWSAGLLQQSGVALLIALYSLALHGSLRVLGWGVALTVVGLWCAVLFPEPVDHPWATLFLITGTVTGAVTLGLTFRTSRLYLAALEDRAARLEIERDQRVRLTAAAERSRIAREMHDIVGHNLAVMIGLADGAAVLAARRDEQAAQPLRIIGDTGRQALDELRRVLGVLRGQADGDPAGAGNADDVRRRPQPGVTDLDALLARVRAAGLGVTYRTTGDLGTMGSGVQLAVYRVVQESLTNTLKHAGAGSSARVMVAAENDQVRVSVLDTGPPAGAQQPPRPQQEEGPDRPRHGLVGIRERAALYGGTVTAGPRADGPGWLVDVRISTRSTAAPAPGENAA